MDTKKNSLSKKQTQLKTKTEKLNSEIINKPNEKIVKKRKISETQTEHPKEPKKKKSLEKEEAVPKPKKKKSIEKSLEVEPNQTSEKDSNERIKFDRYKPTFVPLQSNYVMSKITTGNMRTDLLPENELEKLRKVVSENRDTKISQVEKIVKNIMIGSTDDKEKSEIKIKNDFFV
jgi:hypothetical protein